LEELRADSSASILWKREREREREREKFCREFQVSNVEQICLREQEIVDKEKVFSTSSDPEIFC
jgi:hypothetical protein